MLQVCKTTLADIPGAMEVIDQAKACMKAYGSPQWQDGYPNAELLAHDVSMGEAVVLKEDDQVVGTAMISFREEMTYREIFEGAWKYSDPYVVVHRIAVDSSKKGRGYAKEILTYAEELAKEQGVFKIRMDTHELNESMQRFLLKNGFTYSGVIYVSETGDSPERNERDRRIAFEKDLAEKE